VREAFAQSFGLAEVDGRLEAAGPDYRAVFEPGRFTYVPALGRTAPATMPVSFALEEVRLGDATLLRVGTPPAPSRQGDSVVYAHPGGIEERYEVRADGVHQTFRFASLPAGAGDLVVRGHLETDLLRCSEGEGARFELPGFGGVRWGGVTGIDAGGAAAAGDLRLDGTRLELSLPADFVSGASLPLVLDPLVGSLLEPAVGVNDDADPDVAYDVTEHVYLAVWERWYSSTDTGIRAQRFSTGGSPVGSLIIVATNPSLTESFGAFNPSVASVNKTNRFLVAWQQSSAASFWVNIRCAAVDADDGQISASVAVDAGSPSQYNAVVGGERTELDDDALVVWQQDGVGIRMRQMAVPTSGAPFGTTPAATLEANTPGYVKTGPAISRSGGDDGRFLVTWTRSSGADVDDIEGRVVSRNGQPLGTSVLVSGAETEVQDIMSAVDGDGDRWVVAWSRQELLVPDKWDVAVRALEWNGSALEFATDDEYLESDFNDSEYTPAVAWTGTSALVVYLDEDGEAVGRYAKSVDPFTCSECETEMFIAGEAGDSYRTAATAEWAGGPGTGELDNAWILFDFQPLDSPDTDVLGARYDAPWVPEDLGGGCAGGGENFNPCAFEGNQDFRAQLVGAAPNAPTFWVVSALPEPFVTGACTWTPKFLPGMVLIPRLTDNDGDASAQAPIPLGTAGLTVFSQWATLHAGGGSPLLGGVSFSNALEVTIYE
jgi:hypothetical protein